MSEQRKQDDQRKQDGRSDGSDGWQRAREAFKHAQVTAAVAWHVVSPVAGPVAQQAHPEPVLNEQQYAQQIRDEDRRTDAEWDLLRREQEARQLVREADPAERDREPGKAAARHREPGR